jgi:hypothetical protein
VIQDLARNAKVFSYIPDNTYLVEADASRLEQIRSNPKVRWVGNYQPSYKLSPEMASAPLRKKARQGHVLFVR